MKTEGIVTWFLSSEAITASWFLGIALGIKSVLMIKHEVEFGDEL